MGVAAIIFGCLLALINGFIGAAVLAGRMHDNEWGVLAAVGIAIGILLGVVGNYLWFRARMLRKELK